MALEDIVNVQITRQTTAVSRAGFGTPLILGDSTTQFSVGEHIRYYTGSGALSDASTDLGGTDNPEYRAASTFMSQSPKPTTFALGCYDGTSATDALGNILNESQDWYAIINTTRCYTHDAQCMAWAEANEKLFFVATDDTRVATLSSALDSTTLAYYASANNYARTAVFYSGAATGDSSDSFLDAAAFGITATKDPGSYTLMFKTPSGVVADELTSTQLTNIKAKNANAFHEVGGVDILESGTVGEGEYIDVIIFVDWLKARMTEDIYTAMVNNDKLPFTDSGIQAVVGIVKARLQIGIDNGGLSDDPAPTVEYPLASEVTAADKAARTLSGIVFRGTLAGAIHAVTVTGYVTV